MLSQSSHPVKDQRTSAGSVQLGTDPFVPSYPRVCSMTSVNLYLSSFRYTQEPAGRFRYSNNVEEERLRAGGGKGREKRLDDQVGRAGGSKREKKRERERSDGVDK